METPRMMSRPLVASNRYPVADALEILKGYPATGASRLGDDPLGNAMIRILGKPVFLLPPFLKQPLGGLRSLLLKLFPKLPVPNPSRTDSGPVKLPVGVGRDVDDPEIDAQKPVGFLGWQGIDLAGGQEDKVVSLEGKVCLAPLAAEPAQVVFRGPERDLEPAIDGPDADHHGIDVPGQNSQIVWNGPMFSEAGFLVLGYLVGIGNLGNATDNQLGG